MPPIKKIHLWCLLLLLAAGCAPMKPAPLPADLSRDWGEQKTFDYHGIRINYYEAGRQGPPILLLHGFGACAYTWRYLIPALAARHRVFTVELKGFGLSDKPVDGHYAVADQADLVADFIRRLNLHDLVIMGHSMGGGVTLMTYFKVRHDLPPRVSKLVLIDSAGYPQKLPWYIWLSQIPGFNATVGKHLPPRLAATLVLRKCYYANSKIAKEQISTYAFYSSLPGAPEAVGYTAEQLVPKKQAMAALIAQYKTIKVPVLIIWGKQDEVVPLKVGKKFQRDIPGAQLVVIPKCGHIPLEEQPEATKQAIMEFLKK
jgi:pimeloyl-ACP methyl ester carboxylesterase